MAQVTNTNREPNLDTEELNVTSILIDPDGVQHTAEIADAVDISSIQSSSDVQHDQTTGGTSGNPHADSAAVSDVSSIQSSSDVNHDQTSGGTAGNPHANSASLTDIQYNDDEERQFGTENDVSIRYDSTNDSFRIKDVTSNNDIAEFERTTGNMNISGSFSEGDAL